MLTLYIVVLLIVITLPIIYYTQRGWHISELVGLDIRMFTKL